MTLSYYHIQFQLNVYKTDMVIAVFILGKFDLMKQLS